MSRAQAGICRACAHAKWLRAKGGDELMLCRLAESDSRFPKYPRLPVLTCRGWRAAEDVA